MSFSPNSPCTLGEVYTGSHAPPRGSSAFSLTEVVIALGVAAVAFTSIIALFPLGLALSKESYESTQAALIAKSIMSQILDVQSGTGFTGFRWNAVSTNNDPLATVLANFDVNNYTAATNLFFAYTASLTPDGRNFWKPSTNNTVSGIPKTSWDSGVPNSAALVRVTLNRVFNGGKTYDIHSVEVQVDYPGNLTNNRRNHETFTRICH